MTVLGDLYGQLTSRLDGTTNIHLGTHYIRFATGRVDLGQSLEDDSFMFVTVRFQGVLAMQ